MISMEAMGFKNAAPPDIQAKLSALQARMEPLTPSYLDAIGRNSSIRSTSTFNLARADSMPIARPKTALSKLIPGAASLPVMPSPRSPDGKEPVKSSPRLQDWKPGPVKPLRMGVSEGRSSPRKLQLSASERNLSGFLRQPPAGSSSSGPPPRRPGTSGGEKPRPQLIEEGADAFDERHSSLTRAANSSEQTRRTDPTSLRARVEFRRKLHDLMWNRYVIKEPLVQDKRIMGKKKAEEVKKPWKLEDSIWAPRVGYCDSKWFWDTDACARRKLECDFKRALECGLDKYILRHDKDGDDDEDDDKTEVDEVFEVLWLHHTMVYMLFDLYAALGTSSDEIFSITFNSFSLFCDHFNLVDKKSKHRKAADFDQLFIAVDSSNISGKIEENKNQRKALNRREWLMCMVQIAVMKYVMPGEVNDVSTAVNHFLMEDIKPQLDPALMQPSNETRELWYTEEVDKVLRSHEAALRLIYNRACQLAGINMAGGLANKLVSYNNWRDFVKIFNLVADDLNERDAQLCFVWSRMYTIDEDHEKSRIKWTHLSFEDWLEALCRMARMKAFPNQEELDGAGFDDAPSYLNHLFQSDAAAYDDFLFKRQAEWGRPAKNEQPIPKLIEHIVTLLIYQAQGGAQVVRSGVDWSLTEQQVNRFMKTTQTG